MRRLSVRIAVVGAVAVSACSSFGDAEEPEKPATPDAGTTIDGSAGDAMSLVDGAPMPVACPAAAFCDDFERDVIGNAWQIDPSSAPLAIDSTIASRGQRSLRADVSTQGRAALTRPAPAQDRVSVAFSVRISAVPETQFVTFEFEALHFIMLVAHPDGRIMLAEQRFPNGLSQEDDFHEQYFPALPANTWRRYTLSFDRTGLKARATSDDGREAVLDLQYDHGMLQRVILGASFAAHPTKVWIDDVVLE